MDQEIGKKQELKKGVRLNLANTPTQDKVRRNKRKYRRLQSGKGLASTTANLGLTMGLKAINSVLGKKLTLKFGALKIKNKNIQQALVSDIANYAIEEAQN